LPAGLVLAAGICAALPFQKRDQRPARSPSRPGILALPTAAAMTSLFAPAAADSAAPIASPPAKAPPPDAPSPSLELAWSADSQELAAPQLPLQFPSAAGEPSDAPPPVLTERKAAEARPEETTVPAAEPAPPASPKFATKRHRLRDGDTLEKLAERYLGSENRAGEIFEHNREILSRPDLLPIGAEISILVEAERLAQE
jgi:nucleoid-associated protein YgaU